VAEELPPAVLDLIVNTAQWLEGMQVSIESLTELDAAMVDASAMVDEFAATIASAATEASAAMEESATAIAVAADEAAASFDRLGAAADAAAASQDAAAAASEGAASRASASSGLLDGVGATIAGLAEKTGIAVAGVAAGSLTMAGDFQAAVTRLVTSAGESQQATGMVSQGLLDMSSKVGFTANQLAAAMYPIESAGYHAADGLKVMQAAAEGAKDEGADLTHVADAVTTVMKDYNLTADQAGDITSKMVTAISFGKTNFDAFSKSLSTVLPIAQSVGLSFQDVATVEAAMTAKGTTAQRAAQDVAAAIKSLIAPTNQMKKEFGELNITTDDVRQHLGTDGLSGTLEWLRQVAEKNAAAVGQTVPEAMKKLIGTSPGLQAALEVTSGDADTLSAAIAKVGGATADAQGNVVGFSEVQNNLSFVFSQFKAQLETTAISIGNVMMPAAIDLFKMLNTAFQDMAKNTDIGEAFKGIIKTIGDAFQALRPVMGPLAAVFNDLVKVIGSLLVDALKIIAPPLAVVVTYIDDFLRALEPLLPTVQKIADELGNDLGQAFQNLLDGLTPLLPPLTDLANEILKEIAKVLPDLIPPVINLAKAFEDALPSLVPIIKNLTELVKDAEPFVNATAKIGSAILNLAASGLDVAAKSFVNLTTKANDLITPLLQLPQHAQDGFITLGRIINSVPGFFTTAVDQLKKDIQTAWSAAMQALRDKVKSTLDDIGFLFKNMPTIIGYALGHAAGEAFKWGSDLMLNLGQGINSKVKSITDFFTTQLPNEIKKAAADAGVWMLTTGKDTVNGFINGLAQKLTDLKNWWQNLPNQIRGWVSDAYHWLENTARDLVQGFIDGIMHKIGDIANIMAGGGNSVKNAVKNPMQSAGSWLLSAGADIVHGLWSGITSGWNWLMSNIADFASAVKQGFMDALGINSPSKVMADTVGIGIVEGIALGMTSNSHLITSAVSAVKGTLTAGLSGATTPLGLGLPSGAAGLAAGGAGGGILVINNNVQGSVIAEKQLRELTQTQTLRYNLRNPTNGLSLFGRGSA